MQTTPLKSEGKRRRLIIRLSSLGDLILSTAALESQFALEGLDWVVAEEFSSVLKGHPRVHKIWGFTRTSGFLGWWKLWRTIWLERYDEIYDLHNNLRSHIARIFFWIWSIQEMRRGPCWIVFRKQRWKLYGYFILKGCWPRKLRPISMVERFGKTLGGTGDERPNARHLILNSQYAQKNPFLGDLKKNFICVMPGAQWPGKRWPVSYYVRLIERLGLFPIVLGTPSDLASVELVDQLKTAKVDHISGVGIWSIPQVAEVLSQSVGYLGNDTGLAHLAEAVGVRAWIIYGPTVSDMGFGPWRKESSAFGADLWCRPCGKDGRYCFRLNRKYECLGGLDPQKIEIKI